MSTHDTAIAALNTISYVSKIVLTRCGPFHKCRACFQVARNRLSLECRICNTPYDIPKKSLLNKESNRINVTVEGPSPALMAEETKETPVEGQCKRKRETGRGPYKKSTKFMFKLAAKRAREVSEAVSLQEDFDEWFEKCCVYDESVNFRTICSQLRKKAPNSYQQYCERSNKPYLNKKGFDAAINAKTGSVPVQGTGNKWRFNHIDLTSVGHCKRKALTEGVGPRRETLKVVKRFPFGIPEAMVKSFNDFFQETCRVDFTNSGTRDSGLLMVGNVQKVYHQWCVKNNRPYCPERTSKQWHRAPFVINASKNNRCPPFRLLMFAKLGRMPARSKGVFSTTEVAWRPHKKTYAGHPYYKGLKWKEGFIPTTKYIRKKR